MDKVVRIVAEFWDMPVEDINKMTLQEFYELVEYTLVLLKAEDRPDTLSPKKKIKAHDTMTD